MGINERVSSTVNRLREINEKVNEVLRSIKYVIPVMSGKGGVGKSVISASLAITLSILKKRVALLDADMHGPSIPWILGIEELRLYVDSSGKIAPIEVGNLKVVSIELALDRKSVPVIWRGPLKTKAILDLITLTNWGELDYLIVDLPPGTGDEPLTITRYLKPKLSGIVLVLTPGKMVAHIVNKAKNFAFIVGAKVLGAVINMSYIRCPKCGEVIRPFGELGDIGVKILGELPLEPTLAQAVDEGRLADYILSNDNEWVRGMFNIARRVVEESEGVNA